MTFVFVVVVQSLSSVRLFLTPLAVASALINGYFFLFKKVFFKLITYLLASPGLRCCLRASPGGGFSRCQAQTLGVQAQTVVLHGFRSCGTRALKCRLSGPRGSCMWDLPGPGFKPMCLGLIGRFLTIGPPGKSCFFYYYFFLKFFMVKSARDKWCCLPYGLNLPERQIFSVSFWFHLNPTSAKFVCHQSVAREERHCGDWGWGNADRTGCSF